VLSANPRGAEVVLGTCVELGLDPVVHVSSVSALWRPGLPVVHEDLPPSDWGAGYARSKAAAEVIARRYQEQGAPVVCTYPGGVAGPAAGEVLGDIAGVVANHLRAGFMPLRAGAWSVVDVRDVAAVHAAVMEPGKGPRRFIVGGNYLTMDAQARVYRDLTGRRFPVVPLPPAAMRGFGAAMDLVMRVTPMESLVTREGMAILTGWAPTDDRRVHEQLRVAYRDAHETFGAVLRSLVAAGRLGPRFAGRLASTA
jgi:nucleoside-diphosphate-sugar epimerase